MSSTFFKSSAIYLAANIINALVPFLLIPLMTRVYSQSDYGQVVIFQTTVLGLTGLIGLNMIGAIKRKYYDSINEEVFSDYISSCLVALIISTLFIVCIYLIFSDDLSQLLGIESSWVIYAIVLTFFNFLITLQLGLWQINGHAIKYGIIQVGRTFISASLTVLFIYFTEQEGEGRVFSLLIAGVLFSILACLSISKSIGFNLLNVRIMHIKDALNFGVPLLPHFIGGFLLLSIDRYIINSKLGIEHAAIYIVAYQLSSVFNVFFDAINKAFVPWLYKNLSECSSQVNLGLVKKTYAYFLLLSCMALISYYTSPFFLLLIAGEKYTKSADIVGWLCVGQIIRGMYLMVTNYIFYSKKTKFLSTSTIISGCLNVFLIVLLIDLYSLEGVAYSYCFSMLFLFLYTWYNASKVYPLPWRLR